MSIPLSPECVNMYMTKRIIVSEVIRVDNQLVLNYSKDLEINVIARSL
jgi:hypothetical protein